MPDNDRPSSAPLSEADADRLSERFTASWDEPIEPSRPVAAPVTPVAPASPQKQTLLGIAPIVVVGPSEPPPPPPPPAPLPPPTATAPSPMASLASEVPTAPMPPVSVTPPESSSSPTATAVTTPSKPYVPKDHPGTPAVVLSGDVAAEALRKEERARTAQTIPGQTRSSPLAAPPPAPVPLGGFAPAAAPITAESDDDEYPLKRGGSKWSLVLGALAVVGAGVFAFSKLGGTAARRAEPALPTAQATLAAAAPAPVEPPAVVVPTTPPPPAEPLASSAPPSAEAASGSQVEVPKKATKPARKTVAAPRRPVATKPVSRNEPKTDSAPEPAPAPKPKGVIVRETPF